MGAAVNAVICCSIACCTGLHFAVGGTAAGHKNEIIALGQLLLQTGIGGTDDALGAVAADGIAHAFAGGDADAVMSQPVAGTVGDQQRAGFCLPGRDMRVKSRFFLMMTVVFMVWVPSLRRGRSGQ